MDIELEMLLWEFSVWIQTLAVWIAAGALTSCCLVLIREIVGIIRER